MQYGVVCPIDKESHVYGQLKDSGLPITERNDIGKCIIASILDKLEKSDAVIFYITKSTFDDARNLMVFLFAMGHVCCSETPHVVVLEDLSVDELPIGLQRVKNPVKISEDTDLGDIASDIRKYVEDGLQAFAVDPEIGNAAQGQAWSNFFGYFNIVLPEYNKNLDNVKEDLQKIELFKGVNIKLCKTFFEFVWCKGPNPRKLEDRFPGLIHITSHTGIPEDLRDTIKEKMRVTASRCGHEERTYDINLYAMLNKDKGYVFAGQSAPSTNVFESLINNNKIDIEKSEQQRALYAATSQSIALQCNDTLKVTKFKTDDVGNSAQLLLQCNDTLKVKKFKTEDVGNSAQLLKELQASQELTSIGSEHEEPMDMMECGKKKCFMLYAEKDINYDLVEKIKSFLVEECEILEVEYGMSVLAMKQINEADIVFCLVTPELVKDPLTQFQAVNAALAETTAKVIPVIKVCKDQEKVSQEFQEKTTCTDCHNKNFIQKYMEIVEPLDADSQEFQEKVLKKVRGSKIDYCQKIPISDVYFGLAYAFYYNYLAFQRNTIAHGLDKCRKEGLNIIPVLIEMVPESGPWKKEDMEQIAAYYGKVITKLPYRNYESPIYQMEIDGENRHFLLEECTPSLVLHEMWQAGIAGLNTAEKNKQLGFMVTEMNLLISHGPYDVIREMVSVGVYKSSTPEDTKDQLRIILRKYMKKALHHQCTDECLDVHIELKKLPF